jgi:hypothetical protein
MATLNCRFFMWVCPCRCALPGSKLTTPHIASCRLHCCRNPRELPRGSRALWDALLEIPGGRAVVQAAWFVFGLSTAAAQNRKVDSPRLDHGR